MPRVRCELIRRTSAVSVAVENGLPNSARTLASPIGTVPAGRKAGHRTDWVPATTQANSIARHGQPAVSAAYRSTAARVPLARRSRMALPT